MNCLTHALDQWVKHGGYVAFRRSHHWDVPHAVWLSEDRKTLTSYVPPHPLEEPWHSLYGFEGEVRNWDVCDREPISQNGVVVGAFLLFVMALWWRIKRSFRGRAAG